MEFIVKENLIMKTLSADDAPEVYRVIDSNRAYLRKWLPWVDGTDSPNVIKNTIEKWGRQFTEGTDVVSGIFGDGKYIGNIGLHDIDKDNKTCIIGYWLAERHQGHGIITDCVRTLINYAFEVLELNSISIHCAVDNSKSRAIPERLGFKESGIMKDGETLYGIPHDLVIYKLDKMRLVSPTIEHKQAAWDYRQEYIDYGELHIHGSSGLMKANDYESWLEKITWNQTESTPDWVTGNIYFAFVDGKIVGTIAVRHRLNDSLLKSGGHIGYGVRPSERRKGYGAKMLSLALEKCREFGIDKVLITCDKDNIASAKTAIKNGGVLENEFINDNEVVEQRYWITL